MGYATVAGLPVEVGLYTCIFPMLAYALLGTACRLSFSTTSTIVALTGLAITAAAPSSTDLVGTATTLTLMVGVLLIVFRLIRLGWMLEAVSEATLAGLKVAVGLTIIADQLPKLLGIPSTEGDFFGDVWHAIEQLPEANLATALIGGITIAFLLVLRAWKPKVPGPLIALAVGIGLVVFSGVTDRGVATIPEVPTGLPAPAIPPFQHLEALLPFALAIALMSYFETVTAGRIARQPDDPPIDNDQEYIATGVATIVGSFFQTVPPAGGFSQTQVNTNAGARTQISELVTVFLAVAVALFLAPGLSDIPEATLGAIVVVAVLGLIKFDEMRRQGRSIPSNSVAVRSLGLQSPCDLPIPILVAVVLTLASAKGRSTALGFLLGWRSAWAWSGSPCFWRPIRREPAFDRRGPTPSTFAGSKSAFSSRPRRWIRRLASCSWMSAGPPTPQ